MVTVTPRRERRVQPGAGRSDRRWLPFSRSVSLALHQLLYQRMIQVGVLHGRKLEKTLRIHEVQGSCLHCPLPGSAAQWAGALTASRHSVKLRSLHERRESVPDALSLSLHCSHRRLPAGRWAGGSGSAGRPGDGGPGVRRRGLRYRAPRAPELRLVGSPRRAGLHALGPARGHGGHPEAALLDHRLGLRDAVGGPCPRARIGALAVGLLRRSRGPARRPPRRRRDPRLSWRPGRRHSPSGVPAAGRDRGGPPTGPRHRGERGEPGPARPGEAGHGRPGRPPAHLRGRGGATHRRASRHLHLLRRPPLHRDRATGDGHGDGLPPGGLRGSGDRGDPRRGAGLHRPRGRARRPGPGGPVAPGAQRRRLRPGRRGPRPALLGPLPLPRQQPGRAADVPGAHPDPGGPGPGVAPPRGPRPPRVGAAAVHLHRHRPLQPHHRPHHRGRVDLVRQLRGHLAHRRGPARRLDPRLLQRLGIPATSCGSPTTT